MVLPVVNGKGELVVDGSLGKSPHKIVADCEYRRERGGTNPTKGCHLGSLLAKHAPPLRRSHTNLDRCRRLVHQREVGDGRAGCNILEEANGANTTLALNGAVRCDSYEAEVVGLVIQARNFGVKRERTDRGRGSRQQLRDCGKRAKNERRVARRHHLEDKVNVAHAKARERGHASRDG